MRRLSEEFSNIVFDTSCISLESFIVAPNAFFCLLFYPIGCVHVTSQHSKAYSLHGEVEGSVSYTTVFTVMLGLKYHCRQIYFHLAATFCKLGQSGGGQSDRWRGRCCNSEATAFPSELQRLELTSRLAVILKNCSVTKEDSEDLWSE